MSKGEVNSGGPGGTGDEHRQWTGRAEGSQGADLGLLCDQLALVSMPPPAAPQQRLSVLHAQPPPLVGERSAGGAAEFASRRDWSVLGDIFAV